MLPVRFNWMKDELRAWEGILSHALRTNNPEEATRAQKHIDYFLLMIARASH